MVAVHIGRLAQYHPVTVTVIRNEKIVAEDADRKSSHQVAWRKWRKTRRDLHDSKHGLLVWLYARSEVYEVRCAPV
jgi:hypothetical protein